MDDIVPPAGTPPNSMVWQARAIDNFAAVARSKKRSIDRSRSIIDATRNTNPEVRQNLTVQQLAKLAGVSLQTFYRYFPSKDDLLLALFEDEVEAGLEEFRIEAATVESTVDRLRFVITAPILISLKAGRSGLVTREHHRLAERFPIEVEQIVQRYIDFVAETVAEAVEAGAIRPVDVEATARNIGLLTLSRFHHGSWGMFVTGVEVVAEELWVFCGRSLGLNVD